MEGSNDGYGKPTTTGGVAVPTGGATTAQPEKDLRPGDPKLMGAAPAEKKTISEKVKGLLGGHHKPTHSDTNLADAEKGANADYADATPETGNTDTSKMGCLDRIKSKVTHHESSPGAAPVGSGDGYHPDSSALGTGVPGHGAAAHPSDIPSSGVNNGHSSQSGASYEADHGTRNLESGTSSDSNNGANVNSSAAVHGGWPHPTNPMPPTNANGGAVLTDQHGNLHQGPRDDNLKKEGFVSKIMDKLHSPKTNKKSTNTTQAENATY